MVSPTYTILLSVRSPILAPLYIAKMHDLSFQHVRFEYAFQLGDDSRRQKAGDLGKPPTDLLARMVLSKANEHRNYIAGVADPFRAMIATDSARYAPKILGGIIQHQAFWLASDDEALKEGSSSNAVALCDKIITHPSYTCSYATMSDYLLDVRDGKTKRTLGAAVTEADRQALSETIYSNIKPGFERSFYEHFACKARWLPKKRHFAYLTMDPTDHPGPLRRFLKPDTNEEVSKYNDTLMTALFCGNGWYVKNSGLMDDLAGAISRAIDRIYADPIQTVVDLKSYAERAGDRYMSFDNWQVPHDELLIGLEEMVEHGAYARDLKIKRYQVDRGADLRRPFSTVPIDADQLWSCVAPTVRDSTAKPPAATSAIVRPVEVVSPMTDPASAHGNKPVDARENFRRFVSGHYEKFGRRRSGAYQWLGLAAGAALCLVINLGLWWAQTSLDRGLLPFLQIAMMVLALPPIAAGTFTGVLAINNQLTPVRASFAIVASSFFSALLFVDGFYGLAEGFKWLTESDPKLSFSGFEIEQKEAGALICSFAVMPLVVIPFKNFSFLTARLAIFLREFGVRWEIFWTPLPSARVRPADSKG